MYKKNLKRQDILYKTAYTFNRSRMKQLPLTRGAARCVPSLKSRMKNKILRAKTHILHKCQTWTPSETVNYPFVN